ncbi:16276_t:CDS:1, partial [Rhizophagus irregularis]
SEISDISNLKINVSEITEVWACYGSLGTVSEVYPKRRNVSPIIKWFSPEH